VLIWAGNVVKSMFFNFEFVQFERFVTYLFKITPLQKVNKVVLFIKQLILIKSLNPNLISISIILKGKFGGYGNARKKKIKITTGPVYYYNHPRFGLVVQPTEVSHYFFLYTTTGVTSVICYLKHNH
jgi:hypothetical protein